MGYDRDELACIGERFNADTLLKWSGQVLQQAKQDAQRLRTRGITEQILRDIELARDEVKRLNGSVTRETVSPLSQMRRRAIEDAEDWREEVKGLAKALFDSVPDMLARFRPGVRVSRSLPKLHVEAGLLVGILREHLPAFRGVGVTDSLVQRGEEACRKLDEALRRIPEERAQTPKPLYDLWHALGVLYTRARFLKRVASTEFRGEEARRDLYGYALLRRTEAVAEVKSGRQPAGLEKTRA